VIEIGNEVGWVEAIRNVIDIAVKPWHEHPSNMIAHVVVLHLLAHALHWNDGWICWTACG
jgi:hypothetical protein